MMWQSVPISSICEGIYEGPHATPPSCDSGAYYLGIPSLTMDGQIDFSKVPFISKEDYIKWTKRVIPKYGDIVFTNEATLNLYARIPKGFYGCLGRRLGLVRPLKNKVDTDYLFYYFFSPFWRNVIAQKKVSGSTVERILMKKFPLFPVLLPPLPTQRRIASILSAYDNLIENNNKRIRLLEQMAENLYKKWFVRFRFPGHEKVEMENGLPKGWTIKKLGEFIEFERGVGYGSKDIEDGENVLLSMNNLRPYGGFIRDYSRPFSGKFKEFQKVRKGDLIMSITDMTQDRRIIGYTGLVPPGKDNRVICTHLMKITSKDCNTYFLDGMFNYSSLSRVIAERATGTNVLGLTADILKKVKTLLPPKELQEEYVRNVTPMIETIFDLHDLNDLLTRQRDLLLPRLMSGKINMK